MVTGAVQVGVRPCRGDGLLGLLGPGGGSRLKLGVVVVDPPEVARVVLDVAGIVQRGIRSWETDLTDPRQMARLRARVMAVSTCLGLAAVTSGGVLVHPVGSTAFRSDLVCVVFLLGVLVWTTRGSKGSDREFLTVLLVSTGVGIAVTPSPGPGYGAESVQAVVASTLMAAIFAGRRRHVAYQLAAAIVLLATNQVLNGQAATLAGQLSPGIFDLVVIAFSVRLLRDLAVDAIGRARRGELTDPLTGIPNRRGFENLGRSRWESRAQEQLPVTVLALDIDHFKRINDTGGHAAGDEVLRRLAALLRSTLRAEDIVVRLGGEEFLILFCLPPGQGQVAAERVRMRVEQEMHPITVSIGVHEVVPQKNATFPTELWAAAEIADRALYMAKNTGRNRVISSTG